MAVQSLDTHGEKSEVQKDMSKARPLIALLTNNDDREILSVLITSEESCTKRALTIILNVPEE